MVSENAGASDDRTTPEEAVDPEARAEAERAALEKHGTLFLYMTQAQVNALVANYDIGERLEHIANEADRRGYTRMYDEIMRLSNTYRNGVLESFDTVIAISDEDDKKRQAPYTVDDD